MNISRIAISSAHISPDMNTLCPDTRFVCPRIYRNRRRKSGDRQPWPRQAAIALPESEPRVECSDVDGAHSRYAEAFPATAATRGAEQRVHVLGARKTD